MRHLSEDRDEEVRADLIAMLKRILSITGIQPEELLSNEEESDNRGQTAHRQHG